MGPSVCCHVLAVFVAVMATICCANRAQYFITGMNRRCSGVLPDVFTAVSAAGCCRKCLGESSCLAVNYSPTTMECQLCDGTVENDPVVEGQDAWSVYLIIVESDPTSSTAQPVESDPTSSTAQPVESDPTPSTAQPVESDPTSSTAQPVESDPTSSTAQPGPCEEGWMYYNSSCYGIKREPWTWDSAREYCMALSARLVEIGNQQENAFLVALLESEGELPDFIIWIGLNDMDVEGTLVWPSGAPVTFLNIPAPHTDSAIARCFAIATTGVWFDYECVVLARSVCEKPALQ